MYSLIISSIIYVISSYYSSKILNDYLPAGVTRKLFVFLLSSIAAWLVGYTIDLMFPSQAITLF